MTDTSPPASGGITIVTPADKPHLGEAVRTYASLVEQAAAGNAQAHKLLTFAARYGGCSSHKFGQEPGPRTPLDPRTYSRDPDEIRAYWAERGYGGAVTARSSDATSNHEETSE